MATNLPKLRIENARLLFKNFSGRERKTPNGKTVNREGDRNFCVVIDNSEDAENLKKDGWNIKKFESAEDYDEPLYYLPVAVSFNHIPPKVYMITRRAKVELNESTIQTLDNAEIKSVDLSINPSAWEVNGKSGIKGYLSKMYVVIEEDEWDQKYSALEHPDDGQFELLPFN